jgi:hypothetical protein
MIVHAVTTWLQVVVGGGGLTAAWHLAWVAVTNSTTGMYAKFLCGTWFDSKEGWARMLLPEGQAAAAVSMHSVQ